MLLTLYFISCTNVPNTVQGVSGSKPDMVNKTKK